tara:strand:+ start:72 stop:494 length:423 start_codon:yes stop_codon:yes gene_type:complete
MKTLLVFLTLSLSTLPTLAGFDALAPAQEIRLVVTAKAQGPADVLVSEDDRFVVVFDAGQASGDAFAICLYADGRRVKTLALEACLTKDELRQVPTCRCPRGHRFWRGLYSTQLVGQDLVLTDPHGTKILISLATGAVRR